MKLKNSHTVEVEEDIDLTFGKRLKALREDRKLTQKELAEKVGANHVQISNYETGQVQNLGVKRLSKILKALDINSSYFFEQSDVPLEEFLERQDCGDMEDALMKMDRLDRQKFIEFAQSHAFTKHTQGFKKTRRG